MARDQHVQAHGIPSQEAFGSLSIQIRTHLWISWARIALKHETTAVAVRQEMQHADADQSRLLEREADAGLDGICAAAFALEAVSRELRDLEAVPQTTLNAWRAKGVAADSFVLEVLKHAVDPRGLVNVWKRELKWLFDMRGKSVHYEGAFQPPEAHPLGMNVAPSQVTYSADQTTRAVDLLLGILERCRDRPKPPVKQWSQDMRGAVNELIGRRGQAR